MLNNTQVSNADPTSVSFQGYFTGIIQVSMDFHPRLEQPPKVKFYAKVRSRVPLNKQPNLAFLSGRLTSSSVLGLCRSSLVQRSFFCSDVIIAINVMGTRCCELN